MSRSAGNYSSKDNDDFGGYRIPPELQKAIDHAARAGGRTDLQSLSADEQKSVMAALHSALSEAGGAAAQKSFSPTGTGAGRASAITSSSRSQAPAEQKRTRVESNVFKAGKKPWWRFW